MLLYTKFAPPKAPKRRSRAGCIFCKEKKKKCDEERPQCARCIEHGQNCVYEAVKPRQRRKRESVGGHSPELVDSSDQNLASRLPFLGEEKAKEKWAEHLLTNGAYAGSNRVSPLDTSFDTSLPFPLAADIDLSPLSPVCFGFPTAGPAQNALEEDGARGRAPCRNPSAVVAAPRQHRHSPDHTMIAPCPTASPLVEFCMPAFSEFSDRQDRRALVDHFCNVLSHLIVFREESGNPFQQLVLPLSHSSSPVMNAIYALASAHMENRGLRTGREKSVYFHNQAIQGLARLIEYDGKPNRNELLAAIMLLVYYEVLVQKGPSNIIEGHLKGALAIMCTSPEPSDMTGVFLERAFRFYDVIAALSLGTAPFSTAPAAGCFQPFHPLGAAEGSPLRDVDTLLGMATTLWPVIHRLSTLLALKGELEKATEDREMSKIAVLRTEFETTSEAIKVALRQWQPCLPRNFTPEEDIVNGKCGEVDSERGRIHSILNNALAYRHSAFIYLYRTIHGHPRDHELVQAHVHAAISHCAATTRHMGPMGALLWPLFVAACEAMSSEDRELARRAFDAIDRRQGMTNIERAWDVVREVWRRTEGMEECGEPAAKQRNKGGMDLWRRVSEDMGVNIVFG